ncbi:MAG: putative L,D-transpeptidase YkuD [Verrucomicrobia bacterium ADurb.Bin345]|nr:MAG: putative L,D-transpeptidase YkuD [Verrucomicrobia bacterium ADurb.Bin345]
MTQDLYVGDKQSNRGCLLLILVATLILCGIFYLVLLRPRSSRKATADKAEAPSAAEAAPATQSQGPAAAGSDAGLNLVAEARRLKTEDHLLEAREKALQVLDSSSHPVAREEAMRLLGEVNVELVLSPRAMPEKTEYTVQPGDSLVVLAKRFNTTVDALRKGNRISGSVIRVNDRMRVFSGTFSIQVGKKENVLDLFLNDRFFKRYRVGTGEYGRTPVGDFVITEKIAQPTWWRPDGKPVPFGDPENVLGTHWLSLNIPGYGIHGTWEPDTIGKQASAGCIRLLNEEVEELFTLVPEGTPVTIKD